MPQWLDIALRVLVPVSILIFAVWVKWAQWTGKSVPEFLRRGRKQ